MWASLLIVLATGVVCIGLALYLGFRDRRFRAVSYKVTAEVTGFIQDKDERYQTQYRFSHDGHEVFGVLDKTTPQPVLKPGELILLRVHKNDPTNVRPFTSRGESTARVFLMLIGVLMLLTAIPLLVFVS